MSFDRKFYDDIGFVPGVLFASAFVGFLFGEGLIVMGEIYPILTIWSVLFLSLIVAPIIGHLWMQPSNDVSIKRLAFYLLCAVFFIATASSTPLGRYATIMSVLTFATGACIKFTSFSKNPRS